jgi:hypothetical protein
MSIFDIFKSSQPQPAPSTPPVTPQPGVQNPGQPLPGTHSSAFTAPNGVVPTQTSQNPATPPTPQTQLDPNASPMDAFKDIWQTPTTTDPNQNAPMFANLDPKKLMESAKTVDFSKSLNAETLQKIQAGGADAVAALTESLNTVAQTVYAQSAFATTKIVEQALERQQTQLAAQLPTMVKSQQASENLMANNPVFNNPAVQPLVQAAREMMIRKFPQATSAEISNQVEGYFKALGSSLAPAPTQASTAKSSQDMDWDKFLAGN